MHSRVISSGSSSNQRYSDTLSHCDGISNSSNFLTQFDYSSIEEMDPSITEGHKIVYDREVPFELRVQDKVFDFQEIGTVEAIRSKILVLGHEDEPREIKVEMTSENDPFFHYTHWVDMVKFERMKEDQKFMVELKDYVSVLIKLLNSCIKEPQSFLAIFIVKSKDGAAKLEFIQNLEYKMILLLSCDCSQSNESVARKSMIFRYNALKLKVALLQARLQDISSLIRLKNPSLLLQLQKAARQEASTLGRITGPERRV